MADVEVRMRQSFGILLVAGLLASHAPVYAEPARLSVLTYHNHPDRSGNFIVPGLTWERARSLRLDSGFHAEVSGGVYAQPLYWRDPSANTAMLIVATEANFVPPVDAAS